MLKNLEAEEDEEYLKRPLSFHAITYNVAFSTSYEAVTVVKTAGVIQCSDWLMLCQMRL